MGDVSLQVTLAGEGPLVILLHGFPESWFAFRHQIPALVRAGFAVAAPNLRGYQGSDKPRGLRPYRIDRLAADVVGLCDALAAPAVHLVGHDWGAAIAWMLAMLHPERLASLSVLNGPHPLALLRALRGLAHWRRSITLLWFQLPWLPEWFLRRHDFALPRKVLARDPVRRDAFSAEDIERYVAALSEPGALRGALAHWRAARLLRPRLLKRWLRPVHTPTLLVWGEQDSAWGIETASPGPAWVPNCEIVRLPTASHWVQVDAPQQVNQALLRFLVERVRAGG